MVGKDAFGRLNLHANRLLLRAAADESALVKKADENTSQMLTRFLSGLGFDKVTVAWQENPA